MSGLALTSGWYYICTSYCTPDSNVKIEECGLSVFFIFFLILFFFQFIFHVSIFRTLRLGLEVIGHTITPVISNGVVTALITELERRE